METSHSRSCIILRGICHIISEMCTLTYEFCLDRYCFALPRWHLHHRWFHSVPFCLILLKIMKTQYQLYNDGHFVTTTTEEVCNFIVGWSRNYGDIRICSLYCLIKSHNLKKIFQCILSKCLQIDSVLTISYIIEINLKTWSFLTIFPCV